MSIKAKGKGKGKDKDKGKGKAKATAKVKVKVKVSLASYIAFFRDAFASAVIVCTSFSVNCAMSLFSIDSLRVSYATPL